MPFATITNPAVGRRDYSLVGLDTKLAEERGLASAEWYACPIPRKELKELMKRSDGPALRDTAIWFAALILSGSLGYYFWGTWWAVPCFLVYGVLYGSSSDSRWHECGHGTAFKTRWLNDVVYHIACFMILREPTVWRWSHTRHHTDTIIVGRDAEIVFQRPPSVPRTVFMFTHIEGGSKMFWRLVKHAFGRVDADAKEFVPENEHRKIVWESRVMVAVVAGAAVRSIVAWTPLPILFIGGPSIYGAWLMVFFGITQHAGLRENVLDLDGRLVPVNELLVPVGLLEAAEHEQPLRGPADPVEVERLNALG